jgi:hypothetical protein
MTDRSKFEQMLEHLVNEEQELAKELFHQIVVEKSRQIYENILSEDFNEATKDEHDEDEELDEADGDEEVEENFSFEGDDIGGDPTDDMADELEMDDEEDMGMDDEEDMGMDDEEESGDIEDRVVDLEDAIDDLRAEFEKMMGDEDDMGSDDMGSDDMGSDDMGMDDEDEMASYESDNFMREYIEKVGSAKMGDNGANAKSIVASKNDMGGTSANIAKGGTESESASTKGGLAAPTPKDMSTGNINVPGGNAGKTAFKKKEPGHGAEKKGAGESSDKSAGSPLNGAPRRAK